MEILVTKLWFMVYCYGYWLLVMVLYCFVTAMDMFCYGNIGYKIMVGPPNRGVGKGLKKKGECPPLA
jgi:hypothetical protein